MRKINLLFVLTMLVLTCSSNSRERVFDNKDYINCVNEFYRILFENPNDSIIMGIDIKDRKLLTHGLSEKAIYKIVDKATVVDDGVGDVGEKLVILSFSKNIQVYFDCGKFMEEIIINQIWLPNGKNFYDEIFYRPGMVKRKVGIIYSQPYLESSKVCEIKCDTFFFFTPIGNSNWVIISKELYGDSIGYMLKEDIISFEQFPERKKEEVRTYLMDHSC